MAFDWARARLLDRTLGKLGCALLLHPNSTAISGVLAIWLGLGSAVAQGPYDDPSTAEGWAWSQIERSEIGRFQRALPHPCARPQGRERCALAGRLPQAPRPLSARPVDAGAVAGGDPLRGNSDHGRPDRR